MHVLGEDSEHPQRTVAQISADLALFSSTVNLRVCVCFYVHNLCVFLCITVFISCTIVIV